MSGPSELSFDEILKFMLEHNGKVTNHELVKHFKVFLTNPDKRDEARSTFKKHVNSLANIKNHNNEKWLILKKKYLPGNVKESTVLNEDRMPDSPSVDLPETSLDDGNGNSEPVPPRPPPPILINQNLNLANVLVQEYHTATIGQSINVIKENIEPQFMNKDIPLVQPRRKSLVEKFSPDKRSSETAISSVSTHNSIQDVSTDKDNLLSSKSEAMLVDSEQKISVKERKQMFNRMASEGDILKPNIGNQNNSQNQDEEDRASVVSLDHKSEADPLDPKQKAWILCAARGEYHALAKMCSENSKLAKTKDPFTTAMHWACKRGDENLVKLLAGVARNLANDRSGYTPLHIAMQFRHENVYRLLVDVYGADANLRDWAGKKALQYLVHVDTSFSPGSYRKPDSYDLRRTVTSPPSIRVTPIQSLLHSHPKKEGFLRIGSLNVRVKKTTEAFSHFLGVGATRASAYVPKAARLDERRDDADHLHKNWGSADNIQKTYADKLMPPPLSSKVRRRGAVGRKGVAAHSRSTPSTPDQPRAQIGVNEEGDSDSDSAAGFHSAWRQQRASDLL